MSTFNWSEKLLSGAKALGMNLSARQLEQFELLANLLRQWNKIYNLTAITAEQDILTHHFLDSLAIAPFLPAGHHLDVGCGAGFPGLPLAIALPDFRFTLLDSKGKKTRFVQQAISQLMLTHCEVEQSRVENFSAAHGYQTVLSRAFASLTQMIDWCLPLCQDETLLFAMKGIVPQSELDALPDHVTLVDLKTLHVPGLEAERHLIILGRRSLCGENVGSNQSEGGCR